MKSQYYRVQFKIGLIFFILLTAVTILTIITAFLNGINFPFIYVGFSIFLLLGYGVSIFLDCRIVRIIQASLFLLQALVSITQNYSYFWGWGLLCIALLLYKHYDLFTFHLLRKLIMIGILILGSLLCSVLLGYSDTEDILRFFIYLAFIFTSFLIIERDYILRSLSTEKYAAYVVKRLITEKVSLTEAQHETVSQEELIATEIEEITRSILQATGSDKEAEKRIARQLIDTIYKCRDQSDLRNDNLLISEKLDQLMKIVSDNQQLTEKESEVAKLFYRYRGNITNKEIARDLDISDETVKYRMRQIFRKFNVITRSALILELDRQLKAEL